MTTNGATAPATPRLTLSFPTGRGWPGVEPYVRALELAAAKAEAEVVIADTSGRPAPAPRDLAATTRWLSFPRSSISSHRAELLAACRTEILAFTEDHCLVDPDWGTAMLAAHDRYPEALAIGGPVANVATRHIIDWASYLSVQTAVLPPQLERPVRRLAHANVSYKRAAFEKATEVEGMGLLDSFLQEAFVDVPGAIRVDPSPVVGHDQSLGARGFVALHFHAGRTYGGFVRSAGGSRVPRRLAAAPAVPWARLGRAIVLARRSSYRTQLPAAIPWMLALLSAQAAGQVIGILAGPGDSPLRVDG